MTRTAHFRLLSAAALALGCLAHALVSTSAAQVDHFTVDPVWRSGAATLSHCIALGDVDLDGDLDLVSSHYRGPYLLYLNQNGLFDTAPAWSSARAATSQDLALGDIDGDGDLDLVCANYDEPLELYRNVGGQFEAAPSWTSAVAHRSFGVALGDVDSDGDLDLVCSDSSQPTSLYRNMDGMLESYPDWTALANADFDVALGDIDQDGDLDLVCAGYNAPHTLYLNLGSTFAQQPTWSSATLEGAQEVRLGDVDGDGALDAVFAIRDQCRLYVNAGGTFPPTPTWSSPLDNEAFDVALGDVDGDGDLDLVCAGLNDYHTLFLNAGGTFEDSPAWSSSQHGASWSIALGDVDGDGDLDLVSGNDGPDELYRNLETLFEALPSWESTDGNPTLGIDLGDVDGDEDLDLVSADLSGLSLYRNIDGDFDRAPSWRLSTEANVTVALGDMDGDGDPDLVVGRNGQPNVIHWNVEGNFEVLPAWSSAPANMTYDVDLGDVDGDGDLDVVCANYDSQQPSTLYRNDGGIIDSTPAWSAGAADRARGVALGDVDGDGDLDVVFGCSDQSRLYRNEDGTFMMQPAWSSPSDSYTWGVDLGDVDGDGDLDLVCANLYENTLYWNVGGTFASVPSWSTSSSAATTDVALGDMDGDGDLDLVCGNGSVSLFFNYNHWYRNEGGVFGSVPTWISEASHITQSIALGDIDADGDLDLVCGNREESPLNTLYRNTSRPEFRSSIVQPTNHLPNNPAHFNRVRFEAVGLNLYRIGFDAVDVESDPFWVFPEFQYAGDPDWLPILDAEGAPRWGPFTMSAREASGAIDWDVSQLPYDHRDVIIRLRMTEIPATVSVIQHVTSYAKAVGPILPRRAQIALSASAVDFDTPVTLGDTLVVRLMVSNVGTEPLVVSAVDMPSPELRVDPSPPFDVPASGMRAMSVYLEPRNEVDIAGNIEIFSNDPTSPQLALPVSSNVRALQVQTRLLSPAHSIPLGESVTVVVQPELDVRVESGWLFHRPGIEASAFSDSIPLSRWGDDFIAIIPGERVTEAGLRYYVRVENSGVFANDPPAAPAIDFEQPVDPPAAITVQPTPTHGSDYLAGREVNVQVLLPRGAIFSRGAMHYRRGGDVDYGVDSLSADHQVAVARIPEDVVGSRGAEFWVEVVTQSTEAQPLTDPPVEAHLHPRALRVRVQSQAEPDRHPGGRYRMLSLPLELDTGSIENILSDQMEFGPYDPVSWRAFRFVPDLSRYVELSDEAALEHFRPLPGRAFWLVSAAAHQVDTAPVDGYSVPTTRPYEVPLQPGWNQIGNPFGFPVAWESVGHSPNVGDLVAFDPSLGQRGRYSPEDVSLLVPFEGYFVYSSSAEPETLFMSPVEAPARVADSTTALGTVRRRDAGKSSAERWTLSVNARSRDAEDMSTVLGVRPAARDDYDRADRLKPPPVPGPWLRLAVPHDDWGQRSGLYRHDFRSPVRDGHRWDLILRSQDPGEDITLSGWADAQVRDGLELRIVDLEQGITLDLRDDASSYRLLSFGPDRDYRLAILAGTEDYVEREAAMVTEIPGAVVLDQNAPNPFNPSTRIRFGLPSAGRVTLVIYTTRGERVATLLDQERLAAGFHTRIWDGEDYRGQRVSSGVYLYQLVTGDQTTSKKMVLMQ